MLYNPVTHADNSRGSKAFSGVYDSAILCVRLSVCLHNKTKTAETEITKLGTEKSKKSITGLRPSINIMSKVKGQGYMVTI